MRALRSTTLVLQGLCAWIWSLPSPSSSASPAADASPALLWWKDDTLELVDMWELLRCDDLWEDDDDDDAVRPVHDPVAWAQARGAYVATVGPDRSSLAVHNDWGGDSLFGHGFPPHAVEVRAGGEKGRAVYATVPFRRGEMVWRSDFVACFATAREFRHFLASVPGDFACDVFDWAYCDKSYGICVDLDAGSYVNHATADEDHRQRYEDGAERPNIAFNDENTEISALTDIEPGEELLIDYGSFCDDDWEFFGLGSWAGRPLEE
mmetsp:Transcript_22342/g.51190  ORF Transcript_22342/g.51190 Transcript_22342/m.51190 type:complete len:265 (-) Transcript_22342:307-1101(-)